jgi:hypothetical protein
MPKGTQPVILGGEGISTELFCGFICSTRTPSELKLKLKLHKKHCDECKYLNVQDLCNVALCFQQSASQRRALAKEVKSGKRQGVYYDAC